MKPKIFVDGEAGTTGLKLRERLTLQKNIELLHIGEELHRDANERARLLNEADIAFLCLPDAASREAVAMVTNPATRIIDASTAFRCDDGWVYGFPELERGQRDKMRKSKRVAVPGCHATGFTAVVHPLIVGGILGPDIPLSAHSVSGYTGGGKKLVASYEQGRSDKPDEDIKMKSPRFYALDQHHKHLPEMVKINGLGNPPVFTPIVGDFDRGMLVAVPLSRRLLRRKMSAGELQAYYASYYGGEQFISVLPFGGGDALDGGYLNAAGCNGTNRLELFVFGHDDNLLVIARLDNLGKGASGAAVQCMNILLGQDEGEGLLN